MTTEMIDKGLMAQLLKEAADEHARLHGHEDHDWVLFYADYIVRRLKALDLHITAYQHKHHDAVRGEYV